MSFVFLLPAGPGDVLLAGAIESMVGREIKAFGETRTVIAAEVAEDGRSASITVDGDVPRAVKEHARMLSLADRPVDLL